MLDDKINDNEVDAEKIGEALKKLINNINPLLVESVADISIIYKGDLRSNIIKACSAITFEILRSVSKQFNLNYNEDMYLISISSYTFLEFIFSCYGILGKTNRIGTMGEINKFLLCHEELNREDSDSQNLMLNDGIRVPNEKNH